MSNALLIAHEERRRQNWPTVTVLAGPVSVGVSGWKEWCRALQRPSVAVEESDPALWLRQYAAAFLAHCDPVLSAEAYLAGRISRDSGDSPVARKSLPELRIMFDTAALGDAEADCLCRRLLESAARGASISAEAILEWFADSQSADHRLASLVGAVVGLLPPGRSPALLVVPSPPPDRSENPSSHPPGNASAEIDAAAEQLVGLTTQLPRASVGLCVDARAFRFYLEHGPESHTKAVLREGLVALSGMSAHEIFERVARRIGRLAAEYRRPIEQLAAQGASPLVVDRYIEALVESLQQRRPESPPDPSSLKSQSSSRSTQTFGAAVPQATSDDPETISEKTVARSAAELYLYTLLESTPGLAGLFALNADPGLEFGGLPMEIDLACLSKQIAIEIDGYYHFRDPAAYRRDRRKDVLLQKHGFLVLRFLAEDVVADLEAICETIRSAVGWRHSGPTDDPKGTS